MSWQAVTTDDVLSEFNGSERGLLEDVQADTSELEAILTRTINAARGAVQAGGGRVGAAGTVPDQLAPDIVAIARWRWILSVPKSEPMQTPERKALHDSAEKRLEKVSTGEIKTEDPTTPADSAVRAPSFETKRRQFDRCGEDGL